MTEKIDLDGIEERFKMFGALRAIDAATLIQLARDQAETMEELWTDSRALMLAVGRCMNPNGQCEPDEAGCPFCVMDSTIARLNSQGGE